MTSAEFQSFAFEKGLRRGLEFSSPFTDSRFFLREGLARKKIKTAEDLFTVSERKGIEKEKIVSIFIFSRSALTITRTVELSKKKRLWTTLICSNLRSGGPSSLFVLEARGKGLVLFFALCLSPPPPTSPPKRRVIAG